MSISQRDKVDILARVIKDASIGSHTSGHGESSAHISFYETGEAGAKLLLEAAKAHFHAMREKA